MKIQRQHRNYTLTLNLRPRPGQNRAIMLDFTTPAGQRIRLSTGAHTLEHAAQVAQNLDLEPYCGLAFQAKGAHGHDAQATDPRIADLARHYTHQWLPNRNAAPRSIHAAESHLEEFQAWCRTRHLGRTQQLGIRVVEDYNAHLRNAGNHPKTIHNKLVTLRAMLNAALKAGLLDNAPVTEWLLPKLDDRDIYAFTPDELRAALDAFRDHGGPATAPLTWIALTGNRPSDACDLRWDDVHLETRTVRRRQIKTKRLAHYQIPQAAADLLRGLAILAKNTHRQDAQASHVFHNARGNPWRPDDLLRWFRTALRLAKHPRAHTANVKTLRHTYGQLLVDAGCPLPIVQTQMGHRDIKTTLQYVRASDATPYLDRLDNLLESPKTKAPAKSAGAIHPKDLD